MEIIRVALPTLAVIHLIPGWASGLSLACSRSASAAMSMGCSPPTRPRARSTARLSRSRVTGFSR
jgi:hypothetical protein